MNNAKSKIIADEEETNYDAQVCKENYISGNLRVIGNDIIAFKWCLMNFMIWICFMCIIWYLLYYMLSKTINKYN